MKSITIQLTKKCMLKCPYCFAGEKAMDSDISPEILNSVKKFILENKIPLIRLTGGEPFLNKNCVSLINSLSETCVDIKVFSNLCVPNCFSNVNNPHKLIILANINEMDFYSEHQYNIILSNLVDAVQRGISIILGRTFYHEPFYIDDLISLAKKYNIKSLRVSPANPMIEGNNVWMKSTEIEKLMLYLKEKQLELDDSKITINFDCPIPPCIIKNKEIYNFFYLRNQLREHCGNRLVVCSDGSIEHCYITTSIVHGELNNFLKYEEIQEFFNKKLHDFSISNQFSAKCQGCKYFNGVTPCGCYGYMQYL